MEFHMGAPASTARRLATHGREALGDLASGVTHALHDAGDTATHAARDYYRLGRNAAYHSARDIEHYVEEQPVRSALFALGVGCIVAALLIRR